MSKIDALGQLASLENQTSAIQTINDNSDKIETAIEGTLSRYGEAPNQMEAPLDMNSQRILNLPAPITDNEPARWADLKYSFSLTGEIVVPAMSGNAGKFLTTDGTDLQWLSAADITSLGDMKKANNLSELTNVPQARTNLGLGTAATYPVGTSGAAVVLADQNTSFTGNNTFSGSNTLSGTLSVTGTADILISNTGATLSDRSAGFRGAPAQTRDANYTWTAEASGLVQVHTSGTAHTYILPPSFVPEGHFVSLVNVGAGAVTVSRGSGVSLRKLGTGADANLTVSQWGAVTLYQYSLNNWIVLSSVNAS